VDAFWDALGPASCAHYLDWHDCPECAPILDAHYRRMNEK
jgi:hypothetical protein